MVAMRRLVPAVLLALGPALAAQTYVVDAANGPGANFTDLPAAVAAVPDGAILLVRPGSYSGFAMTGKGITILGDAGANVTGPIAIDGTAATQPVTLRQLSWSVVPPMTVLVRLTQCGGPALLEGLVQPAGYASPFNGTGVSATTCAQVTLRQCQIACAVILYDSSTAIESCTIRGEDYYLTNGFGGRAAVYQIGGSLQVCGATLLQGGNGMIGGPSWQDPGDGIFLSSGSLRVVGGVIRSGTAGGASPSFLAGMAIWSFTSPDPRVSPRVTLFGSNVYNPQVPNDDVMPQLTGSDASPGGTLSATVDTETNDLVVLAVSLPGPTTTMPGILDPFWLDAALHVFVALGVQQPAAPITGTAAVPNNPAFTGLRLVWQAACQGPVTGLQATNPVVTLVH